MKKICIFFIISILIFMSFSSCTSQKKEEDIFKWVDISTKDQKIYSEELGLDIPVPEGFTTLSWSYEDRHEITVTDKNSVVILVVSQAKSTGTFGLGRYIYKLKSDMKETTFSFDLTESEVTINDKEYIVLAYSNKYISYTYYITDLGDKIVCIMSARYENMDTDLGMYLVNNEESIDN